MVSLVIIRHILIILLAVHTLNISDYAYAVVDLGGLGGYSPPPCNLKEYRRVNVVIEKWNKTYYLH